MEEKLKFLSYQEKEEVLKNALNDLSKEDRENINWYADQILIKVKTDHPKVKMARDQVIELLACMGIMYAGKAR